MLLVSELWLFFENFEKLRKIFGLKNIYIRICVKKLQHMSIQVVKHVEHRNGRSTLGSYILTFGFCKFFLFFTYQFFCIVFFFVNVLQTKKFLDDDWDLLVTCGSMELG